MSYIRLAESWPHIQIEIRYGKAVSKSNPSRSEVPYHLFQQAMLYSVTELANVYVTKERPKI